MTNHDDGATPFLDQLQDALIQRSFMQPWERDREFEQSGGKLLYAVDADVFYAFGSPGENAAPSGAQIGYGQVFGTDDVELSAALAQRLMDHIFFNLSKDDNGDLPPLLVVPPIEEEVAGMLNALIKSFGRQPPTDLLDFEEFRKNVESLTEGIPSGDLDEVYGKVLKLAFLRTGPHEEFRRLARLLQTERLAEPEVFAERVGLDLPMQLKPVLKPFSSIRDIYTHLRLADEWLQLLTPSGQRLRSSRITKLERDAAALARLELWNRILAPHSVRILYVTGARHILEASRHRITDHTTYYERYVRHPRYFLADHEVIPDVEIELPGGPNRRPSRFSEWLRTFLGDIGFDSGEQNAIEDRFKLTSQATAIGEQAYSSNPSVADELKQQWHEFTKNLRGSYKPPRTIIDEILNELLPHNRQGEKAVRQWIEVRESLDHRINSIVVDTWNKCFAVATKSGFSVTQARLGHQDLMPRVLPPLYFGQHSQIQQLVKRMSGWSKMQNFDSQIYQDGLQSIRDKDASEYPYYYYLVHAVLFAARGQWDLASIVCDQAISVVPNLRKSKDSGPVDSESANGREAYYLACFSRRHAARRRSDLRRLGDYIQAAEDVHMRERQYDHAADVISERFDAERLAIQYTELLFEHYLEQTDSTSILNRARVLMHEFALLRSIIKKRCREAKTTDTGRSGAGDALDDLRRTYEHLNIRLISNILSIYICFLHDEKSSNVDNNSRDVAFDAYGDLKRFWAETGEYSQDIRRSYFVEILRICTMGIAEHDLEKKEINRLRVLLDDSHSHEVLAYDRQRFQEIKEFAKNVFRW